MRRSPKIQFVLAEIFNIRIKIISNNWLVIIAGECISLGMIEKGEKESTIVVTISIVIILWYLYKSFLKRNKCK